MIVFMEHIVKCEWCEMRWTKETHVWWHIVYLLNYTRSDLSNMHINEKTVVSIDLGKLFWGQIFCINIVLNVAMLMRQNYIWVSIFISWGFKINNL